MIRVAALLFFLSFNFGVRAEHVGDVEESLMALEADCDYRIHGALASLIRAARIKHSSAASVLQFDVEIPSKRRKISARLEFGCPMKPSNGEATATTAKDQIKLEDAGGRYARIIEWQKSFYAENFLGTIAYVKSNFGDSAISPIPAYFLVCPNEANHPCFSLEINNRKHLERTDIISIINSLRNISILHP